MKKKLLKQRVSELELELASLQKYCSKLEKDKLSIYNLLYKVNKELDAALSNKQKFIASMSHELRSPLTALLGNSTLLAYTSLTPQQEKYLAQLNESAEFLMALLSDLLDVSKLKESKIELDIQKTHLDRLLMHCANMVEPKIAKDVTFNVNIPMLPYYTFVDKKRLQQIFINLLTNAAKFTKTGKIEFSLDKVTPLDNQLEVVVRVEDTGIGISEEIKEKLFEPFSSTDAEEGTGLGLYIAHELATLMGGNIVVESTVGEGSRFKVTFYCEKAPLREEHYIKNRDTLKERKQKNYGELKVLVVEDIEVNRAFLKEMFKLFFSIEIDIAENGAVAIEKVKKSSYDIIFMDMRMPVMDGLEATRVIRKVNKDIPIVCMSANVYREDKHEAYLAGMNDFIEKPLEYTDIEVRLDKLVSREGKEKKQKSNSGLQKKAMQHFQNHFDEETSLRFIDMAKSGLEKSIVNIEKNLPLKQTKVLYENFHAIKGVLMNLGLDDLGKEATLLQDLAKADDIETIEKRIEDFLVKVKEFFK